MEEEIVIKENNYMEEYFDDKNWFIPAKSKENFYLMQKLKTDEEIFEFLNKNEEKNFLLHVAKYYLKFTLSKIFFQSSKLILFLYLNLNENLNENENENFKKKLKQSPISLFAIFYSIKTNFFQFIDYLLENEINIFMMQQRNETIFDYAVYLNNENALNYLFFNQIYLNNKKFFHPKRKGFFIILKTFFTAISINNSKLINYFFNIIKIDINNVDKKGLNALQYLCNF